MLHVLTDIFSVQKAYQGFVHDFVTSPDIKYFHALNKYVFVYTAVPTPPPPLPAAHKAPMLSICMPRQP